MRAGKSPRLTVLLLALAPLALLAALALGWRDSHVPVLRQVTVPVDGLQRTHRILHVSDLHGERFGERQSGIADLIGKRQYDAVAFTGDATLVRGADTRPAVELIEVLLAAGPVFFVPGNHDDDEVGRILARAGAKDLSTTGSAAVGTRKPLVLITLPAVQELPAGTVAVALEHIPPPRDRLQTASAAGVAAVLSGHAHGGNMRLPGLGALISPPMGDVDDWVILPELKGLHVGGLEEREGVWVHISRGLGVGEKADLPRWLYFRFGVQAELTEVVLEPSSR